MSQSSDDRGVMPRMQPVKYIAELEHVREVSIACEGDLQFWQDYLRPTNWSRYREMEGHTS